MKSGEWTVAITIIALAAAKDKTSDEIAFMAALLAQLSSTLAGIAAGMELEGSGAPTPPSAGGAASAGSIAGTIGAGG